MLGLSDLYTILELPNNASDAEVKRAYRRLVMLYHPDRNSSHDAQTKFLEIQKAYDILMDPSMRERYATASFQEENTSQYNDESFTQEPHSRRRSKKNAYNFYFDPNSHSPKFSKSYYQKYGLDYFTFTRLIMLAVPGVVVSLSMNIYLYEMFNPVAVFFGMPFIFFNLCLLIDLNINPKRFHGYIISIIEHTSSQLFALKFCLTSKAVEKLDHKSINGGKRYIHSFYVSAIDMDLKKYNHFSVYRSSILRICISMSAHEATSDRKTNTTFFKYRVKSLYIMAIVGLLGNITLMISPDPGWISSFYFILQVVALRVFTLGSTLDRFVFF